MCLPSIFGNLFFATLWKTTCRLLTSYYCLQQFVINLIISSRAFQHYLWLRSFIETDCQQHLSSSQSYRELFLNDNFLQHSTPSGHQTQTLGQVQPVQYIIKDSGRWDGIFNFGKSNPTACYDGTRLNYATTTQSDPQN